MRSVLRNYLPHETARSPKKDISLYKVIGLVQPNGEDCGSLRTTIYPYSFALKFIGDVRPRLFNILRNDKLFAHGVPLDALRSPDPGIRLSVKCQNHHSVLSAV